MKTSMRNQVSVVLDLLHISIQDWQREQHQTMKTVNKI
jgi:hypothetical protein